MNRIIQHIPNFVDIEGKPKAENFKTTKELLSISWVKRWTEHLHFSRWEINESDFHLMAVFKDGKEWYVVGYIDNPQQVDLPKWKPTK